MMNYTLEEIYVLVGRDDKAAGLTFKYDSDAYKKYGEFITVVFEYNQFDREKMEELVKVIPFSQHGFLRARYLGFELASEKVALLLSAGISSNDISEILYSKASEKNTFHSTEKRELNKIEIPMRVLPKGGDLDWMYGFSKRLVADGIGLSPKERAFYLAGKLYYESENLTDGERDEIFLENGELNEAVEWEFLEIKYNRQDISDEEKEKLTKLYGIKKSNSYQLLDEYLKQAGSSAKKLAKDNIEQAAQLLTKIMLFRERRLSVMGKHPIYVDIDSYLHIYMRHVEEFQVNKHFENKDNFQWQEDDIFNVMGHIIKQINEEYQQFKEQKPQQRFSKYGRQSVYFEGDYYTFHIEPNGRISTFHKNKKEHERPLSQ